MSIRKFSTSGLRSGRKFNTFWDQSTIHSDFESLETITVGSTGASTITFSSIPSTYAHLQVRALNVSADTYVDIQFNGDTGNNYNFQQIETSNGTISGTGGTNIPGIYAAQLGANATFPCYNIIDIYDYASTTRNKTVRSISGACSSSGGIMYFRSGVWKNSNAINQIRFRALPNGTFSQHTTYALYGIRG